MASKSVVISSSTLLTLLILFLVFIKAREEGKI